jgi:hypothetical protein
MLMLFPSARPLLQPLVVSVCGRAFCLSVCLSVRCSRTRTRTRTKRRAKSRKETGNQKPVFREEKKANVEKRVHPPALPYLPLSNVPSLSFRFDLELRNSALHKGMVYLIDRSSSVPNDRGAYPSSTARNTRLSASSTSRTRLLETSFVKFFFYIVCARKLSGFCEAGG